jgi:hypothetical protein
MDDEGFRPICKRPEGLVPAVRVDPKGVAGPTPRGVRGRAWERIAPALYVPRDRPDCVEQRILEQSARLAEGSAVTGWAALRWRGAAYFDGRGPGGREELPVPLQLGGGNLRPAGGSLLCWEQVAPSERERVGGIWVTTVQRALFDEMRRVDDELHRLRTIEMTVAARLTTAALQAAYVARRCAWTGVPQVRATLPRVRGTLVSPQEVWLHHVWEGLDLSRPLANQPVYDLDGNLIGVPDLFDPEAGTIGEYDGAQHKSRERHRKDVAREDRFRNAGLEYFTVVAGDSDAVACQRMLDARARSKFLPPESRAWTLTPPPWVRPVESLDHYFERRGLVGQLTHT